MFILPIPKNWIYSFTFVTLQFMYATGSKVYKTLSAMYSNTHLVIRYNKIV